MISFIIKYWIEFGFGIIISLISYLCGKLRSWKKESNSLKLGITALLRDSLIKNYNKYMDLGYCPIYAKENIEDIYNNYHVLGGNGVGTKMYDKLMELPTTKNDKKSEKINKN